MKRYVSIWFRHLIEDRMLLRRPELAQKPFVFVLKERGRMLVKTASRNAEKVGIGAGMVLADARAVFPDLEVLDHDPLLAEKLLRALAEWTIRYSPLVAFNLPDGLMLDATGCTHLWGNESAYLKDIASRLKASGYDVRTAMADTIGTAWAVCRYSRAYPIIPCGEQLSAMLPLPPQALRIENQVIEKMMKLGLDQVQSFIYMPASVLRRRFGQFTLDQIGRALGTVYEAFEGVFPLEPYQERISCIEPITTAEGIGVALQKLLENLCAKLAKDSVGARKTILRCFRVDGESREIGIGTSRASCSAGHLYKLFELKICIIEPGLGIELFVLEAPVTEPLPHLQERLWDFNNAKRTAISELIDRFASRVGEDAVRRYLPAEHHWPERAIIETPSLTEMPQTQWRKDLYRPVLLLKEPERIKVTVPVPDYPPMLFLYNGNLHSIKKADGPNRIEQEWWISDGLHRDYYTVEDQQGGRFWIFRLGHYDEESHPEWFIHGFFA